MAGETRLRPVCGGATASKFVPESITLGAFPVLPWGPLPLRLLRAERFDSMHSYLMPLLRITGILEGLSFLVLLLFAMPLKYVAGRPEWVQYTGAVHGGLFVAYVALALWASYRFRWAWWIPVQAVVASLLPGGPFWMDRKFVALATESNPV